MFTSLLALSMLTVMYIVAGLAVGADPFFFLKKRVYLLDRWNGQIKTRLKTDSAGQKWAYVSDFAKVGHVILYDDGTTGGESTYVVKWSFEPFDVDALKNDRYRR